jgi:repressor LexA
VPHLRNALRRVQHPAFSLVYEPSEEDEQPKRRKTRGIELGENAGSDASETSSTAFLPVMGQVAAGLPLTDETGETHWGEQARESIELPPELLGGNEPASVFVLDVDGDSMVDDGILEGDRVVVSRVKKATTGNLVVARFFNETSDNFELTVKRYIRRHGNPWLMPANAAYEPINASDAEIVGTVIALLRYPL